MKTFGFTISCLTVTTESFHSRCISNSADFLGANLIIVPQNIYDSVFGHFKC